MPSDVIPANDPESGGGCREDAFARARGALAKRVAGGAALH